MSLLRPAEAVKSPTGLYLIEEDASKERCSHANIEKLALTSSFLPTANAS